MVDIVREFTEEESEEAVELAIKINDVLMGIALAMVTGTGFAECQDVSYEEQAKFFMDAVLGQYNHATSVFENPATMN